MVYTNFEELNKNYGEVNRDKMSFDEEISYIEDCFDTYETIGFVEAYSTPYSEHSERNGMKFKVEGRVSYVKEEADLETLPSWHIVFEDGFKTVAYPEEICLTEILERKKVMQDINYKQALMKLNFIIKDAELVRALFSYEDDSMMTNNENHTRALLAAEQVIKDMSEIKKLLEDIKTEI